MQDSWHGYVHFAATLRRGWSCTPSCHLFYTGTEYISWTSPQKGNIHNLMDFKKLNEFIVIIIIYFVALPCGWLTWLIVYMYVGSYSAVLILPCSSWNCYVPTKQQFFVPGLPSQSSSTIFFQRSSRISFNWWSTSVSLYQGMVSINVQDYDLVQ